MPFTIQDIKNSLTGMAHGTTLSKVKNLNDLFRRAANTLLSKIDPPETIRISQITNAVHDDIHDYSAPSDLKGDKIIDIRPQINRGKQDSPYQVPSREFDLMKANHSFSIRHNKGVKSLRLSIDTKYSGITLHNMDSVTANGTWSVGGDAENITVDTNNYMSGSASINFDLSGAGTTGYIENDDMDEVDLSDEEDIGKIFVRVYLPDADKITNVILRWGSSPTAYWSDTQTSPHDQSSFKNGWNIIAFDWNGAAKTGSPDSSAVNYLRVTITYDGTPDTDFRVDKIVCSAGEIYEIEYYSKYLFSDSSGTWSDETDSDTDYLNLDVDGYNLFLYECLKLMAQQMQGEDSGFDYTFSKEEERELYKEYKKNHPSQAIRKRTYYYRI